MWRTDGYYFCSVTGLPSHAFSRNYYCRFCSFNTTKSKVHLYHLVDVHGVDYKIFSCDRCDYASRWKCKVRIIYSQFITVLFISSVAHANCQHTYYPSGHIKCRTSLKLIMIITENIDFGKSHSKNASLVIIVHLFAL